MALFSLKKEERIRKKTDFIDLNLHGKRCYAKHFLVILRRNRGGITRLGITASKKVGNSVKRNKVKRLIREFFRLHKTHFPQGYDVVVVAKKGAYSLDYWKTKEELGEILLDKKFPIPCEIHSPKPN